MSQAVACQCEHIRHMGGDGHEYGAAFVDVAKHETVFGVYELCEQCRTVCHSPEERGPVTNVDIWRRASVILSQSVALSEAFRVSEGSANRAVAVLSLSRRFGPDRQGFIVQEWANLAGRDVAAVVAIVTAV